LQSTTKDFQEQHLSKQSFSAQDIKKLAKLHCRSWSRRQTVRNENRNRESADPETGQTQNCTQKANLS